MRVERCELSLRELASDRLRPLKRGRLRLLKRLRLRLLQPLLAEGAPEEAARPRSRRGGLTPGMKGALVRYATSLSMSSFTRLSETPSTLATAVCTPLPR